MHKERCNFTVSTGTPPGLLSLTKDRSRSTHRRVRQHSVSDKRKPGWERGLRRYPLGERVAFWNDCDFLA